MFKDRANALKGKVALVMGSGKARIGNSVAEMLAELGVNVALHYRSSESEAFESVKSLKRYGVRVKAFRADITKEQEVRVLVKNVIKEFGRIDILVNTAAAYGKTDIKKISANDFDFFYDVNARGSALTAIFVGAEMLKHNGGVIINIADWAITRPYKDYLPYLISKGSIPTLTRALAVELAPKVRVNYILPGPILFPTDMPKKDKDAAISKTLLKRKGSPENIALAVLHYIMNDYTTGSGCFVDGGRHIEGA